MAGRVPGTAIRSTAEGHTERLDDEKLEMLRAWGAGLSADEREELRAAGKAIVLLIEEIERLQADFWNAKAGSFEAVLALDGPVTTGDREDDLAGSLRSRLSTFVPRLRRD